MNSLRSSNSAEDSAPVYVRGVRRSFGERQVLRGIDLAIQRGEVVSLLGRSGSGKSTFLRALAGLDPEIEGDLRLPSTTAVVFQQPRLLPWDRVIDNVIIGLPASARPRGLAALAEVGIGDHSDAWPANLSGGEAQRVALARALVREPELLLLDEPFGALDALTRMQMQELLGSLIRDHSPAVFLVTHDVDEALILSDRVLVLDGGRIEFVLELSDNRAVEPGEQDFIRYRNQLLAALGVSLRGTD